MKIFLRLFLLLLGGNLFIPQGIAASSYEQKIVLVSSLFQEIGLESPSSPLSQVTIRRQQLNNLEDRIQQLEERIAQQQNPYLKEKLETRLELLKSKQLVAAIQSVRRVGGESSQRGRSLSPSSGNENQVQVGFARFMPPSLLRRFTRNTSPSPLEPPQALSSDSPRPEAPAPQPSIPSAAPEEVQSVYGCMDMFASNYNGEATADNGTCSYETVHGCTDGSAFNYNPAANVDDGSCTHESTTYDGCTDSSGSCDNTPFEEPLYDCHSDGTCNSEESSGSSEDPSDQYGCTNPRADNYDITANVDDGTCEISGCTNPSSPNYDSEATNDDGSCIDENLDELEGCTDPSASNYDPTATTDNGACNYDVYGCTDPVAVNYNLFATIDDGSCFYSNSTDYDFEENDSCSQEDPNVLEGLLKRAFLGLANNGGLDMSDPAHQDTMNQIQQEGWHEWNPNSSILENLLDCAVKRGVKFSFEF